MFRRSVPCLSLAALTALACASPAPKPAIEARPIVPGPGEAVVVDHVFVLVDASSSVPKRTLFREQRALVESFAIAMPDGDYEAGAIAFGGYKRHEAELAPFDRERITAYARETPHLAEGTPIHKSIAEAGEALAGRSGRAAIVLYSDGLPTDEIGRDVDPQLAYDAARQIDDGYDGTVCFHTVQTGTSPEGAAFLQRLSETTACGSFRRVESIPDAVALQRFEREVFLGEPVALAAVSAAPNDLDRDGVIDADDLCPGTPRGAAVDDRGCWALTALRFPTDSDRLTAADTSELDEVVDVLRQNPDMRVRIDGHTDSSGDAGYNLALSERRARAVREYLVSAGISPGRVEAKGWGESQPVGDNRTAEGRQQNRRTELTVLR